MDSYNEIRAAVNLVLFGDAVEHICGIAYLKLQRCEALVFLCTDSQITDDKFLVRTPLWYFMCAARNLRVH